MSSDPEGARVLPSSPASSPAEQDERWFANLNRFLVLCPPRHPGLQGAGAPTTRSAPAVLIPEARQAPDLDRISSSPTGNPPTPHAPLTSPPLPPRSPTPPAADDGISTQFDRPIHLYHRYNPYGDPTASRDQSTRRNEERSQVVPRRQ